MQTHLNKQCEQTDKIWVQYLTIYSHVNLPNSQFLTKIGSKFNPNTQKKLKKTKDY